MGTHKVFRLAAGFERHERFREIHTPTNSNTNILLLTPFPKAPSTVKSKMDHRSCRIPKLQWLFLGNHIINIQFRVRDSSLIEIHINTFYLSR